jgi:hypothetical protein
MRMPAIVPVHKIAKTQMGVEKTESQELTTDNRFLHFLVCNEGPAPTFPALRDI